MLVYVSAVHGATELRVLTVVAFCASQNGGARVVVSYGWYQHLGTGWFATGSQPPVEVCP